MFGDYFQHDAHELLCCLLTHIDDAVTGVRQFCSSTLSATIDLQLQSPRSCHTVSDSLSPAAELSCDNVISPVTSSPVSKTRTQQSWLPGVNDGLQGVERGLYQSVSHHWHSLPSSPCSRLVVDLCMPRKSKSLTALLHSGEQHLSTTVTVTPDVTCNRLRHSLPSSPCSRLAVDLCMPRKCKSLNASLHSGQQHFSTTVTVSPDLVCDRLKRKRKSSPSSLIHHELLPTKRKNFASVYCISGAIDDLEKNCGSAMSDCLQDGFLADCSLEYKSSSSELHACQFGDCRAEDCILTQLVGDDKLACSTLNILTDGSVSSPVADDQGSQVSEHTSLSAKAELLLSLHALESGRSCYISLCRENISGLSPSAALCHGDTLKRAYTPVRDVGMRRHVGCVRDMFGGQLSTETKCLNCGSVASRTELYEDVALFTGRSAFSRTCHTLLLSLSFIALY